MWWDWSSRPRRSRSSATSSRAATLLGDRATLPNDWDIVFGVALIAAHPRSEARAPRPGSCRSSACCFLAYALLRAAPAAAVDAQGLRHRAAHRRALHDARRHLRRRGRRLVDAHHPVHDLRRVPAVLRRRQVLHRFLVRGDGRQALERGPRGGAGLVPARRAFGLGRRDHGDARLGRVAAAREGPATARKPRAGCSPRAASARSSRRRCSAPPRS